MSKWLNLIRFFKIYKPSEETIKRHQEREKQKQEVCENITPEERVKQYEFDKWLDGIVKYYLLGNTKEKSKGE